MGTRRGMGRSWARQGAKTHESSRRSASTRAWCALTTGRLRRAHSTLSKQGITCAHVNQRLQSTALLTGHPEGYWLHTGCMLAAGHALHDRARHHGRQEALVQRRGSDLRGANCSDAILSMLAAVPQRAVGQLTHSQLWKDFAALTDGLHALRRPPPRATATKVPSCTTHAPAQRM